MKVQFASRSCAEYLDLHAHDARLFTKLNALIEECRGHPFKGIRKPEPLGDNLSGWWSRRINHEHRLVYRVAGSGDEQVLQVAQCRIIIDAIFCDHIYFIHNIRHALLGKYQHIVAR